MDLARFEAEQAELKKQGKTSDKKPPGNRLGNRPNLQRNDRTAASLRDSRRYLVSG
jgi:hypothetical protein